VPGRGRHGAADGCSTPSWPGASPASSGSGSAPWSRTVLGLRLEKGHSAADWSTRPLPESWLVYAALDVEVPGRAARRPRGRAARPGQARAGRRGVRGRAPRAPARAARRSVAPHLRHPPDAQPATAGCRAGDVGGARCHGPAPRHRSGRILPDSAIVAAVTAAPRRRPSSWPARLRRPLDAPARRHWFGALQAAAALPEDELPLPVPGRRRPARREPLGRARPGGGQAPGPGARGRHVARRGAADAAGEPRAARGGAPAGLDARRRRSRRSVAEALRGSAPARGRWRASPAAGRGAARSRPPRAEAPERPPRRAAAARRRAERAAPPRASAARPPERRRRAPRSRRHRPPGRRRSAGEPPRLAGPRVALVPVRTPWRGRRAPAGRRERAGRAAPAGRAGLAARRHRRRPAPAGRARRRRRRRGLAHRVDGRWSATAGGGRRRTRPATCCSATAWPRPPTRQGLGTEAVAVLCAWAERQPGRAAPGRRGARDNEASRRLLRRLGFAEQPDDPPWVRCVRGPERRPRIRGRHVC
jgi:hypothetical protein